MSTVALDANGAALRVSPLWTLSLREARRMIIHPALLIVPAFVGIIVVTDQPTDQVSSVALYLSILWGAFSIFAPLCAMFVGNLVATNARRSHAREMLSVATMTEPARTAALCLGVALGFGALGGVGAIAIGVLESGAALPPDVYLSAAELTQMVLVLIGAGLLGVLCARWLPFPGAMVIIVGLFLVLPLNVLDDFRTGAWFFWWTSAATISGDGVEVAGSPWWHAAYLAALCLCAAVAATLRDRPQWTQLVAVGLPVLALTAAVGWLQLP